MPQRANSRADLGNSKRASDTYDNNNIFLTDQGWVYRHWKGDPLTTDRYWDEILVAGQVDPDPAVTGPSDPIQVTEYPVSGNIKYPPTPTSAYEPDQSAPGTPDGIYDIEYASHYYDGVEFPAKPVDYLDHYENELTDDNGMVKPPGVEDLGYDQFPEVDPENPAAPTP